jgi:hypothetical protein
MRYLWRAYRRGELPDMPVDLDIPAFQAKIMEVMARVLLSGEMIMFVNHQEEPVGMATISYQSVHERRRAFPHFWWFTEGKPRQRLEIVLRFLLNLKKANLVVIEAKEANWPFFEHLCKYGVLRRVGTIRDAYGAGGRSAIYQGVGK